MAECNISERTYFEKLTKPTTEADRVFAVKFYHQLVQEAPFDILGGKLYNLLHKGQVLPHYDTYYAEWYHTEKYAHGWRPLEEQQHPMSKRHSGVLIRSRKQKCRIEYATSMSFYPRAARYHPSEESWRMAIKANFDAFVRSLDHYKTYIVLKLFASDDHYKKIINMSETTKGNYMKEIVDQHELKTESNIDFYTYNKTLEETYNNWKDGTNQHRPLCIKADGTCCTDGTECKTFQITEDKNKTILECVQKMIYCNQVTATASTKKFLTPITDETDLKHIGGIDKIKDIITEITTEPTTKYNLCHNAADASKACKDCDADCCKNLKKFGVEFSFCCCADSGATTCECQTARIREASNLKILVNPVLVKTVDSLEALCPKFNGYKLTSKNFNGCEIIVDPLMPKSGALIFEDGAIELAQRYNKEDSETIKEPDELINTFRNVETEIIHRPSKVCCFVKFPA